MAQSTLDLDTLRRALKEVLVETLQEQKELLHDVFAEVLEDYVLAEAIREGQRTEVVSREEVFAVLEEGM